MGGVPGKMSIGKSKDRYMKILLKKQSGKALTTKEISYLSDFMSSSMSSQEGAKSKRNDLKN